MMNLISYSFRVSLYCVEVWSVPVYHRCVLFPPSPKRPVARKWIRSRSFWNVFTTARNTLKKRVLYEW